MSSKNILISGRILNRFSKDMGLIDEMIPPTLDKVTQVSSNFHIILIYAGL